MAGFQVSINGRIWVSTEAGSVGSRTSRWRLAYGSLIA